MSNFKIYVKSILIPVIVGGIVGLINHPLALVILVVTVVMIVYSLRSNKRAADREAAAVETVEASEGE